MTQSLVIFDSVDWPVKCVHLLDAVEQYSTIVCLFFKFTQLVCNFIKKIDNFGFATLRSERAVRSLVQQQGCRAGFVRT